MQGRLEKDKKLENLIKYNLTWMPKFAEEWYLNLKASGHSEATCADYLRKAQAYLKTINRFFPNEIEASQITYESVVSYLISIQTTVTIDGRIKETSDSYKQTNWYCLNSFLGFLAQKKYIEKNYMIEIKKVSNHDEEKIRHKRIKLSIEDCKKIIQTLDEEVAQDITKSENKAVVLLFISTGMRKSALESINIEDIDFDNATLKVIDKRKEEHVYKLNQMCIDAINDWLKVRDYYSNSFGSDALFINKNGSRLSSTSIANYVYNITEKALGIRLSPHKLRAGFCSIMYEQTGDIEKVRRMVGHKQVSTTQRYIVTDNKEKEEAADIMESLLN